MGFKEEIGKYNWDHIKRMIQEKSTDDVVRALQRNNRDYDDFLALLSPAAGGYIEAMAQLSHELTIKRFGRVMQMYAPVYISNECSNACVYCGFNRNNRINRTTLTVDEVIEEAMVLHRQGFRHLLLVSGESPKHVPLEYMRSIAEGLRGLFASLSIEIYPMDTDAYRSLIRSGIDGLTIYQETYNRQCYQQVHPKGRKRDFDWRLETPDRGGEAGFRRLNVGALLGLSDWRTDGAFLGLHAAYLMHRFWRCHIFVSFPRVKPAAGEYQPDNPVNDAQLVQLICAVRLWLPDAGLSLSTREPAELRDNLIPLGITQMSAGSRTAPGGYSIRQDTEGQFEVKDPRTPEDVALIIASKGYDPVWKDWDAAFLNKFNVY